MFADSLDEFDSAREVVQNLVDEYKASERMDYVDWGQSSAHSENQHNVAS